MSKPKWLDDFNPNPADCKAGCCKTGTKQNCFNRFQGCRCHQPIDVSKGLA